MRTIEALLFAILDHAGLPVEDCERLAQDATLRDYVLKFIMRIEK